MRRIGMVLALAAAVAAQEDARELVKQAVAKIQAQDYAGAVGILDGAVEKFPDAADAWMWRGAAKLFRGEYGAAVTDLSRAVDLGAEGQVYYFRAEARRNLNEPEAALTDYDAWLEGNPAHPDAWLHRGLVRETLGDWEGAIEDYTRLGLLAPEHHLPYLHRAYAKCRIGRYKEAMEDFEGAVFNGATGPEVFLSRARARLALGDADGAAKDVAAAEEHNPGATELYSGRGRYWFDRGEYAKAKGDLEKAVAQDGGEETEYARLYLVLAATRTGEARKAQADLAAYLKKRERKDDWYATLAGFLAGTVPEEKLLARAAQGKRQVVREQECEAYWYAAAQRAAAGEKEKAREYLLRAKATDVRAFIEYDSAEAELARLKE